MENYLQNKEVILSVMAPGIASEVCSIITESYSFRKRP